MDRRCQRVGLGVVGIDPEAGGTACPAMAFGDAEAREPGRPARTSSMLRHADLGRPGGTSPSTPPSNQAGGAAPGQSSNQSSSNQDDFQAQEPAHSGGGLSGGEEEVDVVSFPDDPSDPEEPASEPLGDEKKAIVIYAARNLTNTVDARPTGHGWFSA